MPNIPNVWTTTRSNINGFSECTLSDSEQVAKSHFWCVTQTFILALSSSNWYFFSTYFTVVPSESSRKCDISRLRVTDWSVSGVTRRIIRATPSQKSKLPFLKLDNKRTEPRRNQHHGLATRWRRLPLVLQQVYRHLHFLHCCVVSHTNDVTGPLATLL